MLKASTFYNCIHTSEHGLHTIWIPIFFSFIIVQQEKGTSQLQKNADVNGSKEKMRSLQYVVHHYLHDSIGK